MAEEEQDTGIPKDIDWSRIQEATDAMIDSCGLYLIMCKNTGQCYVGATTRPIAKRLGEHIRDLEQGRHSCWPLQDLFNVYGPESFTTLVCPFEGDDEQLKEFERDFLRLAYRAKRLLNVRHVGINLKRRDDAFGGE